MKIIKKLFKNLILIILIGSFDLNLSEAVELQIEKGTDIHVHVSSYRQGDMTFDPDRALFALWAGGLNRAGIISGAYVSSGNPNCKEDKDGRCLPDREWTKSENNFIASTVKKEPNKFIGFCGVDLNAEWAFEEINRCSEIGLNGLKMHTLANGISLLKQENYKKVNNLINLAGSLGLKILIHGIFSDNKESNKLIEIINNNPQTTIIVGHMLGNDYKSILEIKNPNAFIEISAALVQQYFKNNKEDVAKYLRKFGIEKVLFGSDWPVIHPSETLKVLKEYPFTKEELEKIIWKNAEKLFPLNENKKNKQ